jgi:hypothetical protein
MPVYIRDTDDDLFRRAALLVIRRQHGAITFVQRHLKITFKESEDLVRRMRTRGIVGYTTGSKAAPVLVKECAQCGRIGRRSFTVLGETEYTKAITLCAVKSACRKRWPRTPVDDD